MALRIDSSQNRNLYVGTGTEVAVNDGNAIITGNVGIGTTSIGTNEKLLIKTSVDNSVTQGLVIQRSANTDEGYINYNGGGFQFRSTDGDPIVFGQVSNERVRIKDNGNVGIGTTDPDEKLVLYRPINYAADSALYSAYAVNSTAVDNNKVFKWKTGITGNQNGHNLTF